MPKRKFQSPAIQHAYEQFVEHDSKRVKSFEQELFNAELARKLYDLRTRAGLSQRDLASRVGTTASVICRLEDADYQGHSLAMLKRIAGALGKRLELRFSSGAGSRQRTRNKRGRLAAGGKS
jgi:ribosome-binding protein aMBF1 (putative translation factor)